MSSSKFFSGQENESLAVVRQNKEDKNVPGPIRHNRGQATRSILGNISNVPRRQQVTLKVDKTVMLSNLPNDVEMFQPSHASLHQMDVTKKLLPNDSAILVNRKLSVFEQPIIISSFTEEDDCSFHIGLDTTLQELQLPLSFIKRDNVGIFQQPDYSRDIYKYIHSIEKNYLAKWNYIGKQPEVTKNMRSILVDWLVEVSQEYKFETETLYLAISYIDRFLSVMSVQRCKLQLVGIAAMFIASKYEEIYPPDVSEFVFITEDAFTKPQVLRMEQLILKALSFNISAPTSHLFVSKLSEMAGCDDRITSFAMYLNELSLMSDYFLQFTPSMVAAASVVLARQTLGMTVWPEYMVEISGHRVQDLQACLLALHQSHVTAENCPQQAIRQKYNVSKYHFVTEISPARYIK